MAQSVVPPPKPTEPTPPPRQPDRFEAEIDARVRKTRRQVKFVDLTTGVLSLAIGALVYLLAAAVLDHWVVFGGLGFWGRLLLFAVLVAGAAHYVARHLVPLLVLRVNPIYAAQTLEQARPSLKNALVNFLFLRGETNQPAQNPLAATVLTSLRRSTATELKQIPDDVAVDRIQIVRRGYIFAGVFALAALYLIISPKSPLASAGRILWPWAAIDAPTRVTITNVSPGDAVRYQGQSVIVSADVEGVDDDETVLLIYTTEDGRMVDQEIPLSRPEGRLRYEAQLPPGKAGLQQAVSYHLAAGDGRTRSFQIEIQPALAILIDSIHYDYPDYTGWKDRAIESSGDVRALEGTKVTIRASANHEIAWAAIEINGDPRRRTKMTADGSNARGRLALRMPGDDAASNSEQRSYQIRFAESASGERRENREPARHQIEVIPDLPPEVRLIEPPPETVQLPWDESLELTVFAKDPDFALRRVAIQAEVSGRELAIDELLRLPAPLAAHEEAFQSAYSFEPRRLGLKPGDKVSYWAAAVDNRQPAPNRSETLRRWIEIVQPSGAEAAPDPSDGGQAQRQPEAKPPEQGEQGPPEQSEQGPPEQDGSQQSEDDGQQGESQSDDPSEDGQEDADGQEGTDGQGQEGDQPGDSTQSSQDGQGEPSESGSPDDAGAPGGERDEPRDEPLDGDTNPGEVFEEVLKQRAQEMGESGEQESGQVDEPSQSQPGTDPSASETDTPGVQGPGQQQDPSEGSSQPGDNSGQGTGAEEAGGDDPSDDSQQAPGGGGQQTGREPSDDDSGQSDPTQDNSGQAGKPTGRPGQSGTDPRDTQDGEGPEGAQWTPEQGDNTQTGTPTQQRDAGQRPDDLSPTDQPSDGQPQDGQNQGEAGRQSRDPGGNPLPQGQNQQRRQQPADSQQGTAAEGGQPKSPSISPKQSDSRAPEDEGGDRSGGGGEGGGQESDQPGKGDPGSNTPSDEGGQPSSQQGEGETGSRAGDQTQADRPTGQPGEQDPGTGSGQTRPGDGDAQGHDPRSQGKPGTGRTVPGGQPGSESPPQSPADTPAGPEGSEANREYADRATDLALEYLEEQLARQEPNQELLDRLGWTREDLDSFVSKWRKMKANAKDSDTPRARSKLDDALESLGLAPSGTSLSGGNVQIDRLPKTDARRSDPPPAWREHFRAYTEAVGRARD